MRIGIDFGTSYSAAAAVRNGAVELVKFDGEQQFRTAAFFPQHLPEITTFVLTDQQDREVASIVRESLREQAKAQARADADMRAAMALPPEKRTSALQLIRHAPSRTSDDIRKEAVNAVRRQWYAEQAAQENRLDLTVALFGEEAVETYIKGQMGKLVVSPKLMLGYRLHGRAYPTLLGISTHILRHVRNRASAQFGTPVTSALIGRPVEFRSSMGAAGSAQALSLLTEAAAAAGFEDVTFMDEPAAAAWEFHVASPAQHRTLIIDVGGGTTDIALADVGGNAAKPVILKAWGLPFGGTDVDLHLNLRSFMRVFGKDVTSVSVHHFYSAAAVQDVMRQAEFINTDFSLVDHPYRRRLACLQKHGMTIRLNRAVERTKIFLSDHATASIRLDDIERGLAVRVEQSRVADAAGELLRPLQTLLSTVANEVGSPIDSIYLTGGMSRAPYLRAAVAAEFPDIPLTCGDASLAVVSGLARASA